MRIVWMGAGEIGLPSLKWLIDDSEHEVLAVFTQPDRPVGRKQVLTATVTKRLALERGVPVFQPKSLRRNPTILQQLQDLKPDLIVVMAYGCLLPQAVIAVPSIACINLHASLLPKHRGAAPIQAAILEGDKKSGITVMHIARKLDAGDMIWKEVIELAADETGGTLHDRLAQLGPKTLAAALPLLQSGDAEREVQNEEEVSHTGKLSREDGVIDWARPAAEIERQIRAFEPWPGTTTVFLQEEGKGTGKGRGEAKAKGGAKRLKVFPPVMVGGASALQSNKLVDFEPGSILPHKEGSESALQVMTGDGYLELSEVQLEGRSRMDVGLFQRGQSMSEGSCFGGLAD